MKTDCKFKSTARVILGEFVYYIDGVEFYTVHSALDFLHNNVGFSLNESVRYIKELPIREQP